jgi:nucleoside phosphorylase
MGAAHADRAMAAVDLGSYAACIASGFAGSLRPELGVGDIVIPRAVRSASAAESISCDARLVNEAVSSGGKAIEVMVSSARVASSVAEKNELAAQGNAVDMESFRVIAAARKRGVAAIAIRAISDRHDQAMPVDFSAAVDDRGQVSIGRVLKMATVNPGQISALMRLGRESKAAAESLARFLDIYIERLSLMEAPAIRAEAGVAGGKA